MPMRLSVRGQEGAIEGMPTDSNPQSDVLHSENHSRLTAEEIAKAVARHNKKSHGGAQAGGGAAAASAPEKVKKPKKA
jgi:hypothetical protein